MSIEGKVVLITGGNAGIGRATADELARRGAKVVITSRNRFRGRAVAAHLRHWTGGSVECMQLDLASFESIRKLAEQFLGAYDKLHILINNAGLILSRRRETAEGFEMTFGVNHLGHFLLTDLLLERLRESAPARIINLSSEAHRRIRKGLDLENLQARHRYRALEIYSRSKLANIHHTRELARRLAGTGVTANALHPGVIDTRFGADGDTSGPMAWFFDTFRPLLKSPKEGARTSVHLATAPELEAVTGKYFSDEKELLPSRAAQDDEVAALLWEASEQLIARVS